LARRRLRARQRRLRARHLGLQPRLRVPRRGQSRRLPRKRRLGLRSRRIHLGGRPTTSLRERRPRRPSPLLREPRRPSRPQAPRRSPHQPPQPRRPPSLPTSPLPTRRSPASLGPGAAAGTRSGRSSLTWATSKKTSTTTWCARHSSPVRASSRWR
jgi:hypothetical protein